jgi:PQQ-dependent dehydrogenase (methanol/ethanol family)
MNVIVIARGLLALGLALALTVGSAQSLEQLVDPPADEWPQLGRDVLQRRYSPLDQVNAANVDQLQLTWARDLGFQQDHQGSPSVWDGIMYVSTQTGVVALDATNGEQIWRYEAPNEGEVITDSAPRGSPLVYEGNVFFNTRYGMTVAVDAKTGEEVWSTQVTDEELNEGFSTNPIFAGGKLIVGRTGADFGGAPGRINAMDVENGEILWTFNTVPLSPDDPAYDTWTNPPSWEAGIGGAASWNAGAYDPVTGTVVYGTGQPTPWDRVDARRRDPEGEVSSDLYSASFVGLDVETGELKWYHQVVPGDEWDYDQHTVPIFADLEFDGESRRAAILATTTGFILAIDAESGEILAGNQVAEETTVHLGYEEDWTPIINVDARLPEEGTFFRVCPHFRWAHIAPGAFSPDTGLLYRPNQMGCVNYGAQVLPDDWEPGQRAWFHDVAPRDESYWFENLGQITAVNPVTGEIVWQWGHDYGHDAGPVVTAGNLVFSTSHDRRLRAFDAATGEILWQQILTAASRGGTITYAVDGKQYIASIVGKRGVDTGIIPDYNPNVDIPEPVLGNAAVFVFSLP